MPTDEKPDESQEEQDQEPEGKPRPLLVATEDGVRHAGVHYPQGEPVRVEARLARKLLKTGQFKRA